MAFFNELRRRRVFRVAAGYALSAWLLIEVASVILPAFGGPDWVLRGLIILAALGGVLAVALSWIYDLTDHGIVRTEPLESEAVDELDEEPGTVERAERRPVTVLRFKVDSVAANETDTGAEQLYELLALVHDEFETVIQRHDGHQTSIGAGEANVFFGIPSAHEYDAEYALRCSLELRDAVARLNEQNGLSGTDRLNFAAGIDSGIVVAGAAKGDAVEIVGPPLRGAQRLLAQAGNDELLTSASTLQRSGGGFDTTPTNSDGDDQADDIPHRVLGLARGSRAVHEVDAGASSPLVGRDAELQLLNSRCRRAFDGEGQVVMISGEPGIGKSRLLGELTGIASVEPGIAVIDIACESLRQGEAWYPVKELLRKTVLYEVAAENTAGAIGRLDRFIAENDGEADVMLPLLCDLLDIPSERSSRDLNLSPERQNKLLFEFLLSALMQRASTQPVLVLGEDLHWADPTTLEFVRAAARQVPSVPMLIALAFRSGFDPQLRQAGHVSSINLARLRVEEVSKLIEGLSGNVDDTQRLAQQIFSKSDGVPLFVEEITRTVLASLKRGGPTRSIATLGDDALPKTLQESLMWRLDEHGSARAVIQIAAVLGRDFAFDALAEAGDFTDKEVLRSDLERLIDGELLVQRGFGARKHYRFRHALLQDAAYGSLLLKDRKVLHDKVTQILLRLNPKLADDNPEQLAFHIERGHHRAAAAQYWQLAGQREARRNANHEAIGNFEKALACLDAADAAEPGRDHQILAVLMHLGPSMMALRGYSASEVEALYKRARELSESVEEPSALATALFGQWAYQIVRGNNTLAADRAERLLDLAGKVNDTDLAMEAQQALAVTRFHTGDLAASVTHLRCVIDSYDPALHAEHAYMFGQDPGVASRAYLANALWCQGQSDEAMQASKDALRLALKVNHPHSHAFALTFIARFHQHRGDRKKTLEFAERAQQLCAKNILPVWDAFASMLAGWAKAVPGESEEAVVLLTAGLGFCGQLGIGISVPYYAVLLGQAQAVHGDPVAGTETIDEAIATARQAGGLIELPEMLRIRAHVLAQQDPTDDDIDAALREAIEMAANFGAYAWQLRAANDLADRLFSVGRSDEAEQLVRSAMDKCNHARSDVDYNKANELLTRSVV